MAALDLITIAELKAYASVTGTGRDAMLRTWITVGSRLIEAELGRRLVYRAPLEIATGDNIVAEVALANGGLALAGQPAAAGRNLVVSVLDANRSLTAGLLTVTGTVGGVAGVTEMFDLAVYLHQGFDSSGFMRLYGSKFFTAIASAAIANLDGQEAADKIRIGTTLGYVEYHTPAPGDCDIWSLEWPIVGMLEVNEDAGRLYGGSTALALGTDFSLDPNDGRLTRLAGKLPFPWMQSWRAQKLVYSGGYATPAAVPEEVKDVCRRLVMLLSQEVEKGRLGISGASDSLGNWTRFGPAMLNREMRAQLAPYRRRRYGTDTGEREFDLEAA